jgi:hypothetical protein
MNRVIIFKSIFKELVMMTDIETGSYVDQVKNSVNICFSVIQSLDHGSH